MGGAAGHLQHLYENRDLTFQEIKTILATAANGQLKNATEKLDGMNLVFTWNAQLAELRVARSSGDIARGGLNKSALITKFSDRNNLCEAFESAFKILLSAVRCLDAKSLQEIFGSAGSRWYSVEVIHTSSPNVINYDTNNVVLHGNPVFEVVAGKVKMLSSPDEAQRLVEVTEKMQQSIAINGWYLKAPTVLRLQKLSDGTILRKTYDALDSAVQSVGLTESATIREYIGAHLEDELSSFGLPAKLKKLVVARCLSERGSPSLIDIKKLSNKSDYDTIKEFVDNSQELIRQKMLPIDCAINGFAVELLRGFESSLVGDSRREIDRIKREVAEAIDMIESSGSEAAQLILESQLTRLKSVDNIVTPAEGIVFFWKNQPYKFTGSFASVGQIIGLLKYGRGKVKPILPSSTR